MPHYLNPPIQEVLVDFQVVLTEETQLDSLAAFHHGLEDRFPERKERISVQHGFQLSPATGIHSSTSHRLVDGYLFVSQECGKTVQVRLDGFTFNKVKPYSNWQQFVDETRELWTRYLAVAKPVNISRIGLRYINRIDLPLPLKDLREYCLLFPDLPQSMPTMLSEFFQRFVLPFDSASPVSGSSVTLTFMPPSLNAPGALLPVLLDIDVFRTWQLLSPDSSEAWEVLEAMRSLKNQIFEASLTAKAKELFA